MKKGLGLIFFLFVAGMVWANPPHIGYAYPAGGQQGQTLRVMIGGQYLQNSTNVLVSGEGVQTKIVKYTMKYEPRRLRQFYRNRDNINASIEGNGQKKVEGKELEKLQRRLVQVEKQLAVAEIPEGIDINDKKQAAKYYQGNKKEQFNPQIAGRLRVDIEIAKNAKSGIRELRVETPRGLSNPIYFQVGTLPEVYEKEPNDDHMAPALQEIPVPSILNGQILPGDIDHVRFAAKKGQQLVIDVSARKITPFLADAVPGWFQAVVALYDADGNEVAYQDDYKFNPDPTIFFDVPKTGIYTLAIKDSIYRGREDFVYRIALGELPFITSIFPLGAQHGKTVKIALTGKNLPKTQLSGKLSEPAGEVRHISMVKAGYRSNPMPFAIGDLPDIFEAEPNNSTAEAQPIKQPLVINGRIQTVGDVDYFSFQGKKGDSVSVGVTARRLNSPLDSIVELIGPGIKTPVRNDDYMLEDASHLHLSAGLITHFADSYLLHKLPASGTYFVKIGDTQSKGGSDYAYQLRISPAHPSFKLQMEPSGQRISPGGTTAFTVRVLRSDGFDGAIKLQVKNLPDTFTVSGNEVPAGSSITRFTITAPKKISDQTVSPKIIGTANIGGKVVQCTAVPVDDQMQAFLYRHLVPAQELMLAPTTTSVPVSFTVRVPASGIIELPLGKEVRIPIDGKIGRNLKGVSLKLDHPPEGYSLKKGWMGPKRLKGKTPKGKPRFVKGGVASGQIILTAAEPLKVGDTTSLVVTAIVRRGKIETRYPAPAITVKVVAPPSE